MTADQIRSLQPALIVLLGKFRNCFQREKTFGYWMKYILGLLSDLKRKSIEPIALAAGIPVRTLQEFLAFFSWDEKRADDTLQRLVAEEHASDQSIAVLDASAHEKQGDKTPGVQRQWCGESGKRENCIVGQHLLYTDNDPKNPFSCVLASDLYLPKVWANDRPRCKRAGIPDEVVYRPKWRIGIDQLEHAIGNGVRLGWVTFDEDYGQIPEFWFELDRLGVRAMGEVRKNFYCWPTMPKYRSGQPAHASKRVDNVYRYSPIFTKQKWKRIKIKDSTRGPLIWEVKAARVHLVDALHPDNNVSHPTDRKYWLIVARNPLTREIKYFVSNAPGNTDIKNLMEVGFARWHIEKWFQRAKQETGFGAFEVRTYTSLIRHWLSSRMAMYFLAAETTRLRGEKSEDHVGASRGRGEYTCIQDLEPGLAIVGAPY